MQIETFVALCRTSFAHAAQRPHTVATPSSRLRSRSDEHPSAAAARMSRSVMPLQMQIYTVVLFGQDQFSLARDAQRIDGVAVVDVQFLSTAQHFVAADD